MIFYYLLLGHLLGDFVLQTDIIAGNKGKYWQWNVLHAFLVTLCIFALAIPFGMLTLGLVLLNGVIHFLLDYYKPAIIKFFKMSGLTGFLIDQLLHMSLLYLISLTAIPDTTSFMMQDPQTIKLLMMLVLVTSFAAVLNQFLLGAAFPRTGGKFFEQGEKKIGILTRLLITIALYFSISLSPVFLLLLPVTAIMLIFVYKSGLTSRMSAKQLGFKIALDIAVSMTGICLVFWI